MCEYEWDAEKARTNLNKHGIDFADAVTVFDDLNALTIASPDEEEDRWVTLGLDAFGRALVVVYTWRDEATIRLISARKATKNERRQYESH
jgi:uncharacterized protein